MVIVIQTLYLLFNVAIGRYQAYRFDKQRKRISHILWACIYLAACSAPWFLFHNLLLVVSILVMHLPAFNTALNYFRTPRRPLFYTHPEDPRGSLLDRLWGDAYPAVFFFTSISYVVLIFFI